MEIRWYSNCFFTLRIIIFIVLYKFIKAVEYAHNVYFHQIVCKPYLCPILFHDIAFWYTRSYSSLFLLPIDIYSCSCLLVTFSGNMYLQSCSFGHIFWCLLFLFLVQLKISPNCQKRLSPQLITKPCCLLANRKCKKHFKKKKCRTIFFIVDLTITGGNGYLTSRWVIPNMAPYWTCSGSCTRMSRCESFTFTLVCLQQPESIQGKQLCKYCHCIIYIKLLHVQWNLRYKH